MPQRLRSIRIKVLMASQALRKNRQMLSPVEWRRGYVHVLTAPRQKNRRMRLRLLVTLAVAPWTVVVFIALL